MATKEFILQGFTKRTHLDAVGELFDVADIEAILISIAFVTDSGVEQLEKWLKPSSDKVTVYAGIRNDITTFQGLDRLRSLIGAGLHTVDTGSRLVIFHPKLFMVRGKSEARVLLGSANLTLGGLNNNVEAGLAVHFDLADKADLAVVDDIHKKLAATSVDFPEHVVSVPDQKTLTDMMMSGRLVDEEAIPAPRPRTAVRGARDTDTVPYIKLMVPRLRRAFKKAKAPAPAKAAAKPAAKAPAVALPAPTPGVTYDLMWESKPLERRDLNIPDGKNTAKTGSVNLDKGLLEKSVDHRHYFRDEVFPALTWAFRSAKIDEAFAKFDLVIRGVSFGQYDLAIRHTHSTTSKAYKQKNAMTRLSWGPMRDHVARESLIGRTLALFRDQVDPTRFLLEID